MVVRQRRQAKVKQDSEKEIDATEHDDEDKVVFSLLDILRIVSGILMLSTIMSWLFTGTYNWNYQGNYLDAHYLRFKIWGKYVNLTESELSAYDGSDPDLPIYIAVNGTVFDVTKKRKLYGPSGSYSFFAGKDSARSFATNCLNQQTHDLRGINSEETRRLNGWIEFFEKKYFKVGVVTHEPLTGDPPDRSDCVGKYS